MRPEQVLEAALQAAEGGEAAALVTVVSTSGSTPQKAGAKMVVYADGRIAGTIGGGCVEAEMAGRARRVIGTGRAELAEYDLTPDQAGEDGLVCGGRMQVFLEPILGTPTLCLFGAGHVAQPLARMARMAGFRVEVTDDRARFANAERFPEADRIVVAEAAAAAGQMTLGPATYAVVVTRGHRGDALALAAVLGRGVRFVGLLGSRAKLVHVAAELESRGLSREAIARIHCPLGLAIGAQSPEEIAVSILAEMIAVRRGADPGGAGSMKASLPGRMAPRRPGDEDLK
jgi:xanthine dehydrogenase accessory factor